jgi:hypothetical protein
LSDDELAEIATFLDDLRETAHGGDDINHGDAVHVNLNPDDRVVFKHAETRKMYPLPRPRRRVGETLSF